MLVIHSCLYIVGQGSIVTAIKYLCLAFCRIFYTDFSTKFAFLIQGHAVGHAFTGGSGNQGYAQEAPPAQQADSLQQQQQQANPCAQHLQDFLQCAKSSSGDLNLCYGFNEALRECKASYGEFAITTFLDVFVSVVCFTYNTVNIRNILLRCLILSNVSTNRSVFANSDH